MADRPRRAPAPVIGRALEPLYRAAIARINARFDAGRNVERLPLPVVSVGNLSVGGTGKTPMVMHIVAMLLEHGHRPCVAMRGYTRRGHGGGRADETDSYARAFPSVPVVARPDRAAGVRELVAGTKITGGTPVPSVDCVVLDDGFQHRRIARDLDIVLVDATRSPFEDRLLPAGWLREPVESLRRAQAVVITHAELVDEHPLARLCDRIQEAHGQQPIAITRHAWLGLTMGWGDEETMLGLDWLIGKRVIGCCAVGHPEGFLRSLKKTVGGQGVVEGMILPDHDPFRAATVQRLSDLARESDAEAIVVTDKDWSKLRRISRSDWPCPVVRTNLAIVFDSGRAELEKMVLRAVGGGKT